jgi:protein-disulfide isomerase
VKDQPQLDKIRADQDFALKKLKVDATPTFFINGEMSKGAMSSRNWTARSARC